MKKGLICLLIGTTTILGGCFEKRTVQIVYHDVKVADKTIQGEGPYRVLSINAYGQYEDRLTIRYIKEDGSVVKFEQPDVTVAEEIEDMDKLAVIIKEKQAILINYKPKEKK